MRRALRLLPRVAGFALDAVLAYRLRSAFVVLAVALGIAALTVIITSIDGANRKALEIVDMFGHDAVFILGGDIEHRAVGQRTLTLTWEDARAIDQSIPGAYLSVPMRAKGNVVARRGDRNYDLPVVVGTTEGYSTVWNWPLSEGRDLTAEDVARGSKVALIGDTVAAELFGDRSPVGQVVFLGSLPVQVVGRLSYRGVSGGGGQVDDRMVIPLTTLAQRFNLDRKYFRALRVKLHSPELMDAHVENLRSLLRHLHRIEPDQPDDFTILTADQVLKFLAMLRGGLVAFLGLTAAGAMLVGGFVLANLFSISVAERTTEIGLRKALGAADWTITAQILLEAAMLTCAGALLGMGLGMGLGQALSRLGVLEIQFSPKVFLLSLASALAVAALFGLRPARHAASLDPVQALRRSEG
ncbi:MAG: ABC transporter permease [Thermodesulfobacteriota bacterium]